MVRMITILSDDKEQTIGNRLSKLLQERGIAADYVSISELTIKPCYGCGACTEKTFGKCILQDDMDRILRKLVKTQKLVLITPILWGSYSYKTKQVFDRCAVIGDRYYHMVHGELVKGRIGSVDNIFVIGVKDKCTSEEQEIFEELVSENIQIMNIKGTSYVKKSDSSEKELLSIVEEIIYE